MRTRQRYGGARWSKRAAGLLLFAAAAFAAGWIARGSELAPHVETLARSLRDAFAAQRASIAEAVLPSDTAVDCAALWGDPVSRSARVEAVIDGDSLRLRIDGRITEARLQGVDAPEWNQPGGSEATRALRRRVLSQAVEVELLGRDGYDRELVRLEHAGQDVGCLLVAAGHAWAYTRYPGGERYLAAERQARAQGIGLWAADGPIAPEQWRRKRRT